MIVIARDIEHELAENASNLLKLANQNCWNNVSSNLDFVLTEITMNDSNDPIRHRRKHKKRNGKKKPKTLAKIAFDLEKFYMDIYDINLYFYKITAEKTTLDIRYLLKSSLEDEFRATIISNKPMVHSKIDIPVYTDWSTGRFDLNWTNAGLRHRINLFFWDRKRIRQNR